MLRDQEFQNSRVNMLTVVIQENVGTEYSLRAITNFKRSKFDPSRVTFLYNYLVNPSDYVWHETVSFAVTFNDQFLERSLQILIQN